MIDKVKIGPITYRIKELGDLHTVDEDGCKRNLHGQILYPDAEIRLEYDQNEDVKITCLWHEMIHGLLTQAGLHDHEEEHVIALGYGIVALLRDNPELIPLTLGQQEEAPVPSTNGVHA